LRDSVEALELQVQNLVLRLDPIQFMLGVSHHIGGVPDGGGVLLYLGY
jgi:hypothetical protein